MSIIVTDDMEPIKVPGIELFQRRKLDEIVNRIKEKSQAAHDSRLINVTVREGFNAELMERVRQAQRTEE